MTSGLNHFTPVDDLVAHFKTAIASTGATAQVQQRYGGFVAFSAVTAYELTLRSILCDFALRKHNVFGAYVQAHLERINGRIRLNEIKDTHVAAFGERYKKRFQRLLQEADAAELASTRRSMFSSYSNIIIWRHGLAHQGVLPPTATFAEVESAYFLGKKVYECLEKAMTR